MKIQYRGSFAYDETMTRSLREMGISFKIVGESTGGLVSFDVSEGCSNWSTVDAWLKEHDVVTCCTTKFTSGELKKARWLAVKPTWHHGYPKPDSNNGYRDITYNLREYCKKCGVGKTQKAPFRMSGEPKWGKKYILQLNWVFDEYFVKPDLWRAVFEPLGIDCWPVLCYRTGEELETVVQLKVDTVLEDPLDMMDHCLEVCSECHRGKYLPFTRGMFPAMTSAPKDTHIVKSREWFGSGASANRAIIVSQEIAKPIREQKIKGVSFTPLS